MVMLFDAIFGAVTVVLRRLWRDEERSRYASTAPSEREVAVFRARLRAWTAERSLSASEVSGGYEGMLAGVRVRLRAGLDGSRPSAVEVTMELPHRATLPELVQRGGAPRTTLAKELATVLAEASDRLRSFAIVPSGVRARFSALVDPELVDDVVEACAAAVRRVEARDGAAPYRGSAR